MNLLKTIFFLATGSFLGLTPVLSYYFTHGPSCPCHSLMNTGLHWTGAEQSGEGRTDRTEKSTRDDRRKNAER